MTPAARRRLLFAALYFSEGAPIGWLWWALPSQLRRGGVEVEAITALTAALALPWVFKFVWAPLVDVLHGRWFGLRSWLVTAQLGMAATLVPLLWIDPVAHWRAAFGLLLAHAFCAATQDVAIDALAIRSVPAGERGSLNGAMQVGMIGGRVLFSSGVLYLSASTGERLAVPLLLGVLAATLLLVSFAPGLDGDPAAARRGSRAVRRGRYFRALLRAPRIWRLVAFALVAGAGFEAAGALSGSWLVDRGFTDDAIATFRLVSAALMAAGAWVGGRHADRRGAGSSARTWLLVLAALLFLTAALGSAVLYAAVYFGIGAFTASSYALFMRHSNGPLAATVFSTFMGLTNGCEAWAGRLGGAIQASGGYAVALAAMAAVSLLAWSLPPRRRRT